MILVRLFGIPTDEAGVRELWLSRVPALGETITVDGYLLEVERVNHDLTSVEVTSSGTTIGLNVEVHLREPGRPEVTGARP